MVWTQDSVKSSFWRECLQVTRVCKTFTQGSHLTSHQIIHTGETLKSVQNVARLLGSLKLRVYRILYTYKCYEYGSFKNYCSLFRYVRIYILETNHTNIMFVGRILPKHQRLGNIVERSLTNAMGVAKVSPWVEVLGNKSPYWREVLEMYGQALSPGFRVH